MSDNCILCYQPVKYNDDRVLQVTWFMKNGNVVNKSNIQFHLRCYNIQEGQHDQK